MISQPKDEVLIEDLKNGNIRALGDLYQRHGTAVKSALMRFAPEMSGADVDELCQEVFLTLYDTIERYKEQQRLKGWIFGIAVRKARTWRRNTWLRRKLLNRRQDEAVALSAPDTRTPARALELKQEVEAALSRLTTKQREAVLLFSVEGFSCEETAAVLGVNVRVVWSRLHRARQTAAEAFSAFEAEGIYQGEL